MKKGTVFLWALVLLLWAVSGAADAQAPTSPDEPEELSVFEQLARDPYIRRYGHPPGEGWIPVPSTNSEVRFGGFVQANFIHDFDNTGFPFGDFITSEIPVPTDDTANTEFDPRTSRLTFESQTNVGERGSVNAMISMDFAGSEEQDSIQPRLRQAYVSWVGPKTDIAFTVGQSWSTFLDLAVWPDIFDLEGPNAMTGTRQVVVRGSYTFDDAKRLVGDLAIEEPESDIEGGTGLTSLPDLVARINWQRDWGHLSSAVLLRELVAESTSGTGKDRAFAWGLSLAGQLNVRDSKDNFRFQVQGGSGIGRYVFDLGSAPTPQDAVYNEATAKLSPLEEFGAFGAYQHYWPGNWRSTLAVGRLRMDNLTEQPADALKETTYVVGNLIYRFLDRLDAGFEYYWGERKNKDNQTGRAKRLMFSVKYPF